ncbi:hypothetical protein WH240_05245 [Gluconobacter wancherniae]|uniref:Uncharacterized protein n=1 Tax=Gluconobacter cerinus TaxID=38307 RepID=A0A1B6VPG5_9PROT|nr:hypothetical protein [Gluconobacter cerinus]OAJ69110.1 hypothetical protein A0123_00164 [Gluconobacter cerinus]
MKPYILIVRPRTAPDSKPIIKLLINPQEKTITNNGVVEQAYMKVYYRIVGPVPYGHRKQTYNFPACYVRDCGENGRICLTGSDPFGGAVYLEPDSLLGNRIGSFLMNQIVQWATKWPDAEINPIKLLPHQGHGENRLRRNRFYEQFGITFDYDDKKHSSGIGRYMRANSLVPWKTLPANLTVISLEDFLDEQEDSLLHTDRDLLATRRRNKDLNIELRNIVQHPILFAGKIIWATRANSIICMTILAFFLFYYWYKG